MNEGLAGPSNSAKLSMMAALIKSLKLPWFVVGDLNATPEALSASLWIRYVGGCVVVPRNSPVTCTTSARGSLLDFGVASCDLVEHVDLDADFCVAWKTHVGLHF